MEMWNIVAVCILGGFGLHLGWRAAETVTDIVALLYEEILEAIKRMRRSKGET